MQKHRVRDILEPSVDAKYTLSDRLWQYLQNYAKLHRARGNGFGDGLVDLEGVTRTLSARYYKDGSEILIPQENNNPRRLTPRECARLMGFPDSFKIVVSDTRVYQQFGNSVVVPLVKVIADQILKSLIPVLCKVETNKQVSKDGKQSAQFSEEVVIHHPPFISTIFKLNWYYTSKLAYDGSGVVNRDSKNDPLANAITAI
ncbi:MAG: DNA cytosine methyltransferase [Thermosynechococcus sp.]|uniref:DNA cytosine methyltransferase n=1 Tax=Thermosynechococcus sp. TaxID=2814275 RepID=UPI0039193A44